MSAVAAKAQLGARQPEDLKAHLSTQGFGMRMSLRSCFANASSCSQVTGNVWAATSTTLRPSGQGDGFKIYGVLAVVVRIRSVSLDLGRCCSPSVDLDGRPLQCDA